MRPLLLASVALAATACKVYAPVAEVDYGRPLPYGSPALLPLGPDESPPDFRTTWYERDEILPALERSIRWTRTAHAVQFFPIAGITHRRALASLERFRALLDESTSADAFHRAVLAEYEVLKSAGWDGAGGGVLFTGYCTPILPGSLTPDERYRHPLYALPDDLAKAPDGTILGRATEAGIEPYPTRSTIEASALLADRGLELVWLSDPLDAYIAHVNGSAIVELPDGELYRLGYAGKNGRAYTSLGRELVESGELTEEEVSLATIRRWARQNPRQVDAYLRRNDSYVFFTPIDGMPRGSLNVEVTPRRTLATDKSLFPRGALCFVDTRLPSPGGGVEPFRQLMLDQDTGGAIRTAGRADIYVGVGPRAERLSGSTRAPGQLYYLFLRE